MAFLLLLAVPVLAADPVPDGFTTQDITNALVQPVAFGFTPAGRLYVAEKRGTVQVFDSVADPVPSEVIDIQDQVHNYWDRGLLGFAVDPEFGSGSDFLYLLYTLDLGNSWQDGCPSPPGATGNGCVVNGRLSRFRVNSDGSTGLEQILLGGNWCAQYPSHTIGDLAFLGDDQLLVSAGDGASFTFADHGQMAGGVGGTGNVELMNNPCDDPMGASGTADDEGGSLRSQDLRTDGDVEVSYDGTVLRVNKTSGAAVSGNPPSQDSRIIAYGLRNPFRIAVRPNSSEVWIGDVGRNDWEEVNFIANPGGSVDNFGWPCYEGNNSGSARLPVFDDLGLTVCESLYTSGTAVAPHYARPRGPANTFPNCAGTGGAMSGLAFDLGDRYPNQYDGALFMADYSIGCIRVMFADASGAPDRNNIATFIGGVAAVDLQIGPEGDLYYADIATGRIVQVRYADGPTASIEATPTTGTAPLQVDLDGTNSTDGDGDTLSYAWDLDGDGQFDDSTSAQPTGTYGAGSTTVGLRVIDPTGASDTDSLVINAVGNAAPMATINSPPTNFAWSPGALISFSGIANDAEDGILPASQFSWQIVLSHCDAGGCHEHIIQTIDDVLSGSFNAPDHPHPTFLSIRLTATDSDGLFDTERVDSVVGGSISGGGGGGGGGGSGGAGGGGTAEALFDDVPNTNPFFQSINWLASQRITLGCTEESFCPGDPVTRGEMAVFLARALALLPAPSGQFTDTKGSPYEWAISSVAAAGITQGCAADRYCPDDPVTREQMASFLVRAFAFPVGPDLFTDDEESVHEDNINALANSGVTFGCAPNLYCPRDVVTREQMAAFLFRAFNP